MEECDAEEMGAFLRGVICTGDKVSNLITEGGDFLGDEEFGEEAEGRGTTTILFSADMGAFLRIV